jgi:hypothetical protein
VRRLIAISSIGVLALVGAACNSGGGGGSVAALCTQLEELNPFEIPSDDELDALVGAAPSEIRDDVRRLIDWIKANPDAAFTAERPDEIAQAERSFETWVSENCEFPEPDPTEFDDSLEDLPDLPDLEDLEGFEIEEITPEDIPADESTPESP